MRFKSLLLFLAASIVGNSVLAQNSAGVTLYEHINFGGKSRTFTEGTHDITETDLNDIISSIKIPAGWKVTVYEDWKQTGKSLAITSDVKDLTPMNFNDLISSLKVERGGGQSSVTSLSVGSELTVGQRLTSANGVYHLILQTDGNLCIYKGTQFVWGTMTTAGHRLRFLADGNLCLYNSANKIIWSTATAGYRCQRVALDNSGSLMLYNASSQTVWSSTSGLSATASQGGNAGGGATSGGQAAVSVLSSGSELIVNQRLNSANGQYHMILQTDGNLCIYKGTQFVWGTMTTAGHRLRFLADGNLCLYNAGNQIIWSTSTAGSRGQRVVLDNSGSLMVYGASSQAIWSSTGGRAVSQSQTGAIAAGGGQAAASGSLGASFTAGTEMIVGQYLASANGQCQLQIQSGGNLCVFRNKSQMIWSAGVTGGTRLVFLADGNLCFYNAGGRIIWSSGTNGGSAQTKGVRCVMENSGFLVIYNSLNKSIWTTQEVAKAAPPKLPDAFRLHAYSIHGKRAEKGSDFWIGVNAKEAGAQKTGRIINANTGMILQIEKETIDQQGTIALKVKNTGYAGMYLTVDAQKRVVMSTVAAGSTQHHFRVRQPEEVEAANLKYVSFESVAFPGWFLRHESFELKLTEGNARTRQDIVYRQDATWLFEAIK